MNLYEEFVYMAHKKRCYWFRNALIECNLYKEHRKNYKDCLDCFGEDLSCVNFELDPNRDLENLLKEVDINKIGGI